MRADRWQIGRNAIGALGLAGALVAAALGRAQAPEDQPALLDEMDGQTPVLRLRNPGTRLRIVRQSIDAGASTSGGAAERVAVVVPPGESAHLAYPLPDAPVIDELRLSAWAWCTRPGVQLAAVVALPRSVDADSGRPAELLLRSNDPAAGEGWRKLTMTGLPAALANAARVARAERRAPLDERGARVVALVFLVPGGPGQTELWVDQIAMHGAVTAGREAPPDSAEPSASIADAVFPPPGDQPMSEASVPPRPRPAAPRVLQWQGEPFAVVARLGFDAVGLDRAATPAELAEARRLGLFIVSPPPAEAAAYDFPTADAWEPVLAWDLGEFDPASGVESQRRADAIRQFAPWADRPLMLRPGDQPLAASRVGDLLLERPLASHAADRCLSHATWLAQQRRFARPGAGLWIAVDTQSSPRAVAQWAAVTGGRPPAPAATVGELNAATAAAFSILPRGFYFRSSSSLAASDAATRRRAIALELANLQLGLVEPWLASGKPATAARSSRADVTGVVLTVERSRLIVPARWRRGDASSAEALAFVLPGVPESCDAYLLTVAGPRRLETRRVTGGLKVLLQGAPDEATVLLTEDGFAFSQVERYLRQHASRAVQLRMAAATAARQEAGEVLAALPPELARTVDAARLLARVDGELTAVNRTLQTRDFSAAYFGAAAADRLLDEALTQATGAIWPEDAYGPSPFPHDWSALPALAHVARQVSLARDAATPIPGGEFDSYDEFVAAGWESRRGANGDLAVGARLSPSSPAEGAGCLELIVAHAPVGGDAPLAPIAATPVWVTSPPLTPPAGSLVEITGLVRLEAPPLGSADPLLIFDSVGGEESAVRIESAPLWTPFRLVRVPIPGTPVRVTIALGGVGEAHIDSLRYRVIPAAQIDAAARSDRQTLGLR